MLRHRGFLARTATLTGAVALAGVFGLAAPAAAHITVSPSQASAGDYARLAFRVPTESSTAGTTEVEVVLPEDAPVASVHLLPAAGWTATVEKAPVDPPLEMHGAQVTEAVARIVWTAETPEAAVQPGEFQEFVVMMGPLPEVDQMVFKSLQTYSDGTIVRWIEVPVPGQDEPATPATVLRLTSDAGDEPAADPTDPDPAGTPDGETSTGDTASGADDASGTGLAVGLGVAGLLAGLAGLVLGGLAFARFRRAAPATAATGGPESGRGAGSAT
ncbi:YcnI family protein [Solwaraspora sp. WMMD406]|uniref:YcnI family copper-binding membrane protein n=1 Tax=Solwaraspora sp. WMMD406 TaxID=3016095 RepID=UPI002416BFBA|nr:YcnI family protein [Solwaraspora sp. WMMD406]MDG4767479.1 YcnI family protein [Solwaraspora sp. WMMD406]